MIPASARYRILRTANGWIVQHRFNELTPWHVVSGGHSNRADAVEALRTPAPLYFDADLKEITCG